MWNRGVAFGMQGVDVAAPGQMQFLEAVHNGKDGWDAAFRTPMGDDGDPTKRTGLLAWRVATAGGVESPFVNAAGNVIGADEAAAMAGVSYADYPLTDADWDQIVTATIRQTVSSGETQWGAVWAADHAIVIP